MKRQVMVIGLGRFGSSVATTLFERGHDATEFVTASMKQADITQQEDIAICESVQRGLCSESYDRGRYAPGVEMGEHHFHQLLAYDYREKTHP